MKPITAFMKAKKNATDLADNATQIKQKAGYVRLDWFGNVVDGGDISSLFASAMSYCGQYGIRELRIPKGTFNITSALAITINNIIVKGEGKGSTTINRASNGDIITISNDLLGTLNNIIIENLTLVGVETNKANNGINNYGVKNLIVRNVEFKNIGICGIGSYNKVFTNVTVDNCYFYKTVESGISIRPYNNLTVKNCVFEEINGNLYPPHGVYARSEKLDISNQLFVVNNVFKNNLSATVSNSFAIKVVYNDPVTEQIIKNAVISGNVIEDYYGGVWILGVDGVNINNNIIKNKQNLHSRIAGILITQSSKNVNIANNYILSQLTNYGVIVDSTSQYVKIAHNQITSESSPALNVETGTKYIDIIGNTVWCDAVGSCLDIRNDILEMSVQNNTFYFSQRGIQQAGSVTTNNNIRIKNNILRAKSGTTPTYSINMQGTSTNILVENNDMLGLPAVSVGGTAGVIQRNNYTTYA